MIDDPLFYVIAVPALLLTGISKGGLGAGAGMLSVPLMSIAISPTQAAAIMLPLLCAMDLVGLWGYRNAWDGRHLRMLVPASVVGIGFGALTFGWLPEAAVRVIIGLIAVGFVGMRWYAARRRSPSRRERIPGPVAGAIWGAMSGYTSFVAHAGGPPLSVYLLPQKLDKTAFVGTIVVFFAVVNYVKLAPYWALGQFDSANLRTSLVLLPLAPAGMALGFWLHRRIDPVLFFRICYGLLLVTGAKLLWDGIPDLLGRGIAP